MSRADFALVLAGSVFSLTGCGTSVTVPDNCQVASSLNNKADIIKYCYPEVAKLEPRARGRLRSITPDYQWINYTGREFNLETAARTIAYSQELAKRDEEFSHVLDSEQIRFKFKAKAALPQQILIVNKKDINRDGSSYNHHTLLLVVPDDEQDWSSARFSRTQTLLNRDFAVMTARASLEIQSKRPALDKLLIWIIASSWGEAFAIRQLHPPISYLVYFEWALRFPIPSGQPNITYSKFILPESEYSKIPIVGNIVGPRF